MATLRIDINRAIIVCSEKLLIRKKFKNHDIINQCRKFIQQEWEKVRKYQTWTETKKD